MIDLASVRTRVAADGCRAAVEEALARIARDPHRAVVAVDDDALQRADALQRRVDDGEALPLAGTPVVVKDNLARRDRRTAAGSAILEGYRSPYTAGAIERLEASGAVVVGNANMDEFAMGSSTETGIDGAAHNPRDPTRSSGGSSGGSAAAVAAGLVPLALGSDTGGSIRQPAAFCGCVGLKPTYGRVSRYGLIAFGSSLDQIGPLAATVDDAWVLLAAIAGHDPRDATSSPGTGGALVDDGEVAGMRIGLLEDHCRDADPAVVAATRAAADALADAGADVVPVALPSDAYAIDIYYVLATGEAASNLARYDGIHYGAREAAERLDDCYLQTRSRRFGTEVKRRILLGTYVLSAGYYDAYYKRAQRARAALAADYARVFTDRDVLLGPTSPTTAFPLGERLDDPLKMYLSDVCTIGANLAGIPAVSLPFGSDGADLPVGVQVQAPRWREDLCHRVAKCLEGASGKRGRS